MASQINVSACLDLISNLRTGSLCECIHLEAPHWILTFHNGKTEASILVILYLHLVACPSRAMLRAALRVHVFHSFVKKRREEKETYLLHLNVP